MEQQFDGRSLQYSIDNGSTWINVGAVADAKNCLNSNWFNFSPINYLWNTIPAQTNIIATNPGYGSYTVTVSGTDVGTATGTGKIELDLSCIGVYFPSAFTPGNDGKNDGFGPVGSLAALTDYKLNVYNRWGELVFSSINPFEKWNGKVKGVDTDNNVFVWSATFCVSGKPKELRKGTIMLIR